MLELNLRSFLSEFNGSKFVLYFFLLAFAVTFPLRLDGYVPVSYFLVFAPLWICESLVLIGFLVGLVSFIVSPPPRTEITLRNDFFAMCFCTLEHILLAMFLLLCSYKLEFAETPDGQQMSWLVVCTPLFVQSFMAMIVSVWSIRHDKTFEFEMFFSLNVVQFVFVAFKLDQALHWNWVIVFVPAWVVFSLCLVGTLYSLILSIFLSRSLHVLAAHRRSHIYNSVCHLLLIIPLLTFFLMLSNKLDAAEWLHDQGHTPYTLVASPLWLSLFLLLFMSFGSKTGNTWWFAMRKPFCNFIFDAFPCLQQYANISYRFGYREEKIPPPPRRSVSGVNGFHGEHLQMLPQDANSTSTPEGGAGRTVAPSTKTMRVCSIEMPD